jgi:hypothetical protein
MIIRQALSKPGIVKQIRFPSVKASAALLRDRENGCFWNIHELKFGVDRQAFSPLSVKKRMTARCLM